MSVTERQAQIDPPLLVDVNCKHCGEGLMVVAVRHHGLELSGLRDLDYRHLDGSVTCWLPRSAQPFDGFQGTKAFDRALRERYDAEDAAFGEDAG